MNTVKIAGNDINLDAAKEVGSLEGLKSDARFFPYIEGLERDAACKDLADACGFAESIKEEEKPPVTRRDKKAIQPEEEGGQ